MHAMVRTYTGAGAAQMFDALEARKGEVEAAIRTVPGLVSFTMLRTADGGATVTVCQDKAGAEESLRISREWMQKNLTDITPPAPSIAEGNVLMQM